MDQHGQSDLLFMVTQGRCYGNRFLALIGKNWHIPPSFCVITYNGCKDNKMNACVNTADNASTSHEKFSELWSSNQFAGPFALGGLQDGTCHAFLVLV